MFQLEVQLRLCSELIKPLPPVFGPLDSLPSTAHNLATSFAGLLRLIVGWDGWALRLRVHGLEKLLQKLFSELALRLLAGIICAVDECVKQRSLVLRGENSKDVVLAFEMVECGTLA